MSAFNIAYNLLKAKTPFRQKASGQDSHRTPTSDELAQYASLWSFPTDDGKPDEPAEDVPLKQKLQGMDTFIDDETSSEKASRMRRNLMPAEDVPLKEGRDEPIRTDSGAYRHVEVYPNRAIKFAQDRSRGGRAAPKSDIAISHALASLGYPIVPEYPMAHDREWGLGEVYPLEQKTIDLDMRPSMKDAYVALLNDPETARRLNLSPKVPRTSLLEYLARPHRTYMGDEETPAINAEQSEALREKLTELRDKRGRDVQAMHGEFEDYLPSALDITDLHDYNIGRDPDDPSKFVTFDPMYGRSRRMQSIGRMLRDATSINDIGIGNEAASQYAPAYRDFYRAKHMNPMQFDNFTQLYRDTDIFEPWEKQAEETIHNPNFYPEDMVSQDSYNRQREQNRRLQANDDARYKETGDFLNFINVPDEQRRLFEYDTGSHGRLYRNMLEGLQSKNLKPYVPPQQFRDFREGGPSPVQKSEDTPSSMPYKYDDDVRPLVWDGRKFVYRAKDVDPMGEENQGFETGGANRFALVGHDSVEKYPHGWGRAENKKDLAIFNALASLGYPIVPEQPMAFDKSPRFFPTRQDKTKTDMIDNYAQHISHAKENFEEEHGEEMPQALQSHYKRQNKNLRGDLDDLRRVFERNPLTHTLDIGDIKFGNVGYDDKGNMVTFDPYLGSTSRLPEFGQMLDHMAAPIQGTSGTHYPNRDRPDYRGTAPEKRAADQAFLYQGFQRVPQMQKDSFRQLYHDQEQFSPWQAAEQKLFSDPEAFGEHAPTKRQREQMMGTIDRDDAAYKQTGRAIDFLTTPPEQKRLFEFGNNAHAQRYRNMLNSLQSEIRHPNSTTNWLPPVGETDFPTPQELPNVDELLDKFRELPRNQYTP